MERLPYRSQAWSPLQFGDSLALWLDFSDQSTMTFATGISQLRDKGPRGSHAVQASGALQPTLAVGALNGLSGGLFSSQYLAGASSLTTGGPLSLFIVARMTGSAATSARLFAAHNANSDAGTTVFMVRRNTTAATFSTLLNAVAQDVHTVTLGTAFLFSCSLSTTGFSSRLNGGTKTTTVITPTQIISRYAVGTGLAAGTTYTTIYWNDHIYEVHLLRSVLTDTDWDKADGYLAWKWGLQGSLPSTHPYARNRP